MPPHQMSGPERAELAGVYYQLTTPIGHGDENDDAKVRLAAWDLRQLIGHMLIAMDGRDAVWPAVGSNR